MSLFQRVIPVPDLVRLIEVYDPLAFFQQVPRSPHLLPLATAYLEDCLLQFYVEVRLPGKVYFYHTLYGGTISYVVSLSPMVYWEKRTRVSSTFFLLTIKPEQSVCLQAIQSNTATVKQAAANFCQRFPCFCLVRESGDCADLEFFLTLTTR